MSMQNDLALNLNLFWQLCVYVVHQSKLTGKHKLYISSQLMLTDYDASYTLSNVSYVIV